MYKHIFNPQTNKMYPVNSKKGLQTIRQFFSQSGGGKCGNCGKMGHNGRSCAEAKKIIPVVKSTGRKCKICNQTGHNSRTCGKPKDKLPTLPKKTKKIDNCIHFRKRKDPKCVDQPGCVWVKKQGCVNKTYVPSVKPKSPKPKVSKVKTKSPKLNKPSTKTITGGCAPGINGSVVYDVKENGVLLAKVYDDRAVDGWWASEKWDGYRAIWNGKHFVSRQGKNFDVPDWYKSIMPPSIALDGELWLGRGLFENCGLLRKKMPTNIAKKAQWEDEWKTTNVKFKVFDIMNSTQPFEARMNRLKEIITKRNKCMGELGLGKLKPVLEFTKQTKISTSDAIILAQKIIDGGGEGIMLRKPGSIYEPKRSSSLYKIKEKADMEAVIIGYKPGTGKYTGKLGSFHCALLGNKTIKFYVSGMDDSIRDSYVSTHSVGTIITITYNGLTGSGKPRHPRYLRIRHKEAATSP